MHWRRILGSDLFLGLVLAVLAWSSSTSDLANAIPGRYGWQTALAMAAHNGTAFGTHIVFTYGPLGFLTVQQLNYSGTTVAAYVFTLAISTAVFGALIWSLRRAVPLLVAIVVAYLVGSISLHAVDGPEHVLGLLFVICAAVLGRADDDPAPQWIWVGLGGLISIFSLVKVSLGVGIAAALIVTVAFLPHGRGRSVGALAIGATSTFFLCWFGTGNGFGNIVPFARSSVQVISGYSAAMSIEDPTRRYVYWLAAIVAVLVGLFAAVHGRRLPRRSKIGIGCVALLVVWLLFKEGFVRHDYHDLIFFAVAPLVLVALTPRQAVVDGSSRGARPDWDDCNRRRRHSLLSHSTGCGGSEFLL